MEFKRDEKHWPESPSGKHNLKKPRSETGQSWPILPFFPNFPIPKESGTKIFIWWLSHTNLYHPLQETWGWKCSGGCGTASQEMPSPHSRKGPYTLNVTGKLWPFLPKASQMCGTAVTWAVPAKSTWIRPVLSQITTLSSLEEIHRG